MFDDILGRTNLRISLSGAKFDEEADFEVRSAVAFPKPRQINEKQNFWDKKFDETKLLALKNETSGIVRNAFWQSFVPIEAMFEA